MYVHQNKKKRAFKLLGKQICLLDLKTELEIFAVLPLGWKSPGCWTARCYLYKAPGGFENSERRDKDLEHVNIALIKILGKWNKIINTGTCKPRKWLISLFSTDKYLKSGSFSKIPASSELSWLPARLSHDNLDCLLKPDRDRNKNKSNMSFDWSTKGMCTSHKLWLAAFCL